MADQKITELIETQELLNSDVFAVGAGTPIKNSRKVTVASLARTLSGFNSIIDVNNNIPALNIIQRGTGDCLLVEDQFSDSSPFLIDQNGNTGIGTNQLNSFNKLTVVGNISATGQLVLKNNLLLQNNVNQFANKDFIFGLDASYADGDSSINDGAILFFEYFSDANSRFIISTIDNQNEPIVIAQSGSPRQFGSRLNRIVVGRDGNVGIGTDSLTAVETFPARLTVYGSVSTTDFFIGNVIAETFATAQPSLLVFDTAICSVNNQTIILPITGNDLEIASYGVESLVTGNISLTSLAGGTKGTFFTITNKVPGFSLQIKSSPNIIIRGVSEISLGLNESCFVRVDSPTLVCIW